MPSTVFNWDAIKVTTNANGLYRKFFESPTATLLNLECHVTSLSPGHNSHDPHHHPEEEIVVIREGTVETLVNGEWKRLGPGSIILNACNVTHALRNVGDVPAVYHVFMWKSVNTPAKTVHPDTTNAVNLAEVLPKGVMGPTAIDWNSVEVKTNATGFSRKFFESPTATVNLLECHATTVNPGASTHAPSSHPEEEVIIVKEGTVEAYVNGEWKRAETGSVIFNASNALQAIRNVSDKPATYFVLMWRPVASGTAAK